MKFSSALREFWEGIKQHQFLRIIVEKKNLNKKKCKTLDKRFFFCFNKTHYVEIFTIAQFGLVAPPPFLLAGLLDVEKREWLKAVDLSCYCCCCCCCAVAALSSGTSALTAKIIGLISQPCTHIKLPSCLMTIYVFLYIVMLW